jgi:hypothetical protein
VVLLLELLLIIRSAKNAKTMTTSIGNAALLKNLLTRCFLPAYRDWIERYHGVFSAHVRRDGRMGLMVIRGWEADGSHRAGFYRQAERPS